MMRSQTNYIEVVVVVAVLICVAIHIELGYGLV